MLLDMLFPRSPIQGAQELPLVRSAHPKCSCRYWCCRRRRSTRRLGTSALCHSIRLVFRGNGFSRQYWILLLLGFLHLRSYSIHVNSNKIWVTESNDSGYRFFLKKMTRMTEFEWFRISILSHASQSWVMRVVLSTFVFLMFFLNLTGLCVRSHSLAKP